MLNLRDRDETECVIAAKVPKPVGGFQTTGFSKTKLNYDYGPVVLSAAPPWSRFGGVSHRKLLTNSTSRSPAGMVANSPMAENDPIRIIPHCGVDDDCGSL